MKGKWGFSAPSKSPKHNLLPCWKALHAMVFTPQPEPVPLTQVFSTLSAAPYGLREGLHPVILAAFMMAYRDEVTLYRERTFIPEPGVPDFEVLMRRPELFAISGCHVSGSREAVVERMAKGLHVEPATVPVVRALFRMVKGLPEFSWQTRSLPDTTLALRDAFQNAKSPERFLFVDVPQALQVAEFSEKPGPHREVEAFFATLNKNLQDWAGAMSAVITQSRAALLSACKLTDNDEGWQELRRQSLKIESSVTDPQLLAFIRRVIQAPPDDVGVQSVLALVANRPPQTWTDADFERFADAAKAMGRAFQAARGTVFKHGGAARTYDKLSRTEKKEADFIVSRLRGSLGSCKKQPKNVVIAAIEVLMEEALGEEGKK